MKRRTFLEKTSLTSLSFTSAILLPGCIQSKKLTPTNNNELSPQEEGFPPFPIAICTWGFMDANQAAGEALMNNVSSLDAVIQGVHVEEQNIYNTTVGKGGAPDRDGNVTLDACVMNSDGNYGAVLCVQNISNVAALARKVMEETPHAILAGQGAEDFAYAKGFKKENLLTKDSEQAWEEWKKSSHYKPVINIENHDTIGMLAIDKNGDLSGACTTSGLAYKMKGRVGDSAIIGAGLYIDNEIGGAVATGLGEEVLKTVGSFLIVELMRNGMHPQQACEEAIRRIVNKSTNYKDFQIAYIAINKAGEVGSFCIHEGFTYMKFQDGKNMNVRSASYVK